MLAQQSLEGHGDGAAGIDDWVGSCGSVVPTILVTVLAHLGVVRAPAVVALGFVDFHSVYHRAGMRKGSEQEERFEIGVISGYFLPSTVLSPQAEVPRLFFQPSICKVSISNAQT